MHQYPRLNRLQEMYSNVISNAVKANEKKHGVLYGGARISTSQTQHNLR